MQEGCTELNEKELDNLLAVLAETPPSEACPDAERSSSLPWLDIPIETFCALLLRLVHEDQAYRRTCAALEVLRLRLESLTAPAPRTLVLTIVQAGKSMTHKPAGKEPTCLRLYLVFDTTTKIVWMYVHAACQ